MLHTQSIFLTIPSKYTLRWHIPATSTASMPTSSPCIVIITCSGFPTWKPELAVKSCQIIHSTWQLGHDFLSFWILSVTFSHRLFLTVEPSICANMLIFFFHFLQMLLYNFFFPFLVLFGLTVVSWIPNTRGFIVYFTSTSFAFRTMLGTSFNQSIGV